MKRFICFFSIAFLLFSCDKTGLFQEPEPSPPNVNTHTDPESKWYDFGPLQKILNGYTVIDIAFDSKDNAWIATFNKGIIRYNEKQTVRYNAENSKLPADLVIWDIAVDKNDNVWIGASDGAWKFDGKGFTHYNSKNTAMPEDIVWNIAVDSRNTVWMASCRFNQGGLVKYDGKTWTAYTPENSPLPTNSIHGIAIDQSDNVWLALGDYVNQVYLAKISGNKWSLYGEKELGFKPYYIGGIQCDNKNRLWVALDYSLSSAMISRGPHFFIFDGKNTTQLYCGDSMHTGSSRSGITIDHNGSAWCYGVGTDSGVWIDNQWYRFDFNGEYAGGGAWVIKEDRHHKLWIGTEDGIYIKQ